jgi:sugar (pentulose or hexulose) kinase
MSLVAVDADGVEVHTPLVGDDGRADADAQWCVKKLGADWWSTVMGFVPVGDQMVALLSWLHRSDPDAWSRATRFFQIDEHEVWRESGQFVTTASVATRSGLWSIVEKRFHPDVLRLIDADRDWSSALPTVVDAALVPKLAR